MAGAIFESVQMAVFWSTDHLLLINILLSFVIIFSEKGTENGVDLASGAVFYPNPWIRFIFDDWAGFQEKPHVSDEGD